MGAVKTNSRETASRAGGAQTGLSLIEVLAALAVLAWCMLGAIRFQARSMHVLNLNAMRFGRHLKLFEQSAGEFEGGCAETGPGRTLVACCREDEVLGRKQQILYLVNH
jgi:prepilin-type N-terminal cleavage/methylation domain-containing protein